MNLLTKTISPLEKVFYDDKLTKFKAYKKSSALIGENASFEIAFQCPEPSEHAYDCHPCTIEAELLKNGKNCDSSCVTVNAIEHAPSVYPAVLLKEHDEYLRTMPGLFPDILIPADNKSVIYVLPKITYSLWIDVATTNLESGRYKVVVSFYNEGEKVAENEHSITVIGARLPEQETAVTHWIHADCIADYYGIKVFSKDYWNAVKNTIKTSVDNGSNMIYTPLFTPPLDTLVGGERTTVQLVDVSKTGDKYSFGFDKLNKWIDICKECGAKFYEMSHLFTQWGAGHAPKIIAGGKRIFGWDTDSAGKEYENFLSQFLPALCEELEKMGISENTYFHISDEPSEKHLESYGAVSKIMHKYLKGYKVMDAMSETEFYDEGLVDIPVPHVHKAELFFERNVRPRWIYYCGAAKNTMGREFALPSYRNRMTGLQIYTTDSDGFLHWGFNFYNSKQSLRKIDPYFITDADKRFVSGDSFMVYPAEDMGIYRSLRLAVFKNGIDDLRALKLCESLIGREATMVAIEECNGGKSFGLADLPEDKDFLLKLRSKINKIIGECVK